MASTAAPLIWINGFPGSGKLTIAKDMAKLYDGETIILDNHQLIDPVEARVPQTHPDYQRERYLYRQAMLQQHVFGPTTLSRLVICTDCQSNNEPGRDVAMEYRVAAQIAGRPFIPVYLTCDEGVNAERIVHADRLSSGTTKLRDVETLRELRSRCVLLRFHGYPDLTVDSTSLSSLETAKSILALLKSHSGAPGDLQQRSIAGTFRRPPLNDGSFKTMVDDAEAWDLPKQ